MKLWKMLAVGVALVLAVGGARAQAPDKKDRAGRLKTIADLKGAKIGVTAPGSSTNMIVWYLMAKAGLEPDDASFVGVGATSSAIAAIQRGEIDAISNVDPAISKLQSTN